MLSKNITAFIPARGGSQRFPKKNIARFLGKPLISYPIQEAISSKIFNKIIVSTESKKISQIAKKYGAEVVERSLKNSSNKAHELDACREYFLNLINLNKCLPDIFCVIYPTAVLLKAIDFKKSFKIIKSNNNIDVVMGVSKYNYHPYKALTPMKNGFLRSLSKENSNKRSQYYPDMFASNGTFYWHRTKRFLDKKYNGHYAKNLVGFELNNIIPMDIDYKEDLRKLNNLYKSSKK
jgi:pseudaminic acid cytidylyltransferase